MLDESPTTQDGRHDERPSSDDTPTRRSFLANALAATGGLAATAGLGATAGCVEVLPPLGQGVRNGDVSLPERGSASYLDYVPAPRDGATFDLGFAAHPDTDPVPGTWLSWPPGQQFLGSRLDFFGVPFEGYETVLQITGDWGAEHGSCIALEGPIARDEVGQVLLDSGYQAAGTRDGFDRFERSDLPRAVEVTDGWILFGTELWGSNPRVEETFAAVRRTLDGGPSLSDADTATAEVLDLAGRRPWISVWDGVDGFADDDRIEKLLQARDADADADGDATTYLGTYVRYDGSPPSSGKLRDAAMSPLDDVKRIEVTRHDRSAVIEMQLSNLGSGEQEDWGGRVPPIVTWGAERRTDGLLLRHEAGTPLPADTLSVEIPDGTGGTQPTNAQFADDFETVRPGDELFVPASDLPDDGELFVSYGTGRFPTKLFEYRL